MSRCKACDVIMTTDELQIFNKESEEFEDLCNRCRQASYDNSVIYDDEGNIVERFNEVLFPRRLGGLDSTGEYLTQIQSRGALSLDNEEE